MIERSSGVNMNSRPAERLARTVRVHPSHIERSPCGSDTRTRATASRRSTCPSATIWSYMRWSLFVPQSHRVASSSPPASHPGRPSPPASNRRAQRKRNVSGSCACSARRRLRSARPATIRPRKKVSSLDHGCSPRRVRRHAVLVDQPKADPCSLPGPSSKRHDRLSVRRRLRIADPPSPVCRQNGCVIRRKRRRNAHRPETRYQRDRHSPAHLFANRLTHV